MTTKNQTGDKFAEATRQRDSLIAKLAQAEGELRAAEERLGNDYEAVANGQDVPQDAQRELTDLMGRVRALKAMREKADQAVEVTKRRVFTRAVLEQANIFSAYVNGRREQAVEIEALLDQLIARLGRLYTNGEQLMVRFQRMRGRNTLTARGHVMVDLDGLAWMDHLQHLVNLHMTGRCEGWHYERAPVYGRRSFTEGVADSIAAMMSEFEDLIGLSSLDPEDVTAVREQMVADGCSRQLVDIDKLADSRDAGDGETNIEELMAAAPDFDDGRG